MGVYHVQGKHAFKDHKSGIARFHVQPFNRSRPKWRRSWPKRPGSPGFERFGFMFRGVVLRVFLLSRFFRVQACLGFRVQDALRFRMVRSVFSSFAVQLRNLGQLRHLLGLWLSTEALKAAARIPKASRRKTKHRVSRAGDDAKAAAAVVQAVTQVSFFLSGVERGPVSGGQPTPHPRPEREAGREEDGEREDMGQFLRVAGLRGPCGLQAIRPLRTRVRLQEVPQF